MPLPLRRYGLALALIATSCFFSGCGRSGNTMRVYGKLQKGGEKYIPPTDQLVGITFVMLEGPDKQTQIGDQYRAEYDPAEGTFNVPGSDGAGIPPGKYRVAVTQKIKREAFDLGNPKRKKRGPDREDDTLKDRYGFDSSPIVREVKRDGELVIDLDTPAG